jgi:assimilatory nitrate reductase catalytic subunit
MHWTDRFGSSGPVDRLVNGVTDPVSGQPELKATAARLAPLPTLWRGLLVGGPETLGEAGFYHARIPAWAGVQIYEMRGWTPLPEAAALSGWATRFIGDGTERIEIIDPLRGTYRFATVANGRLKSCLMLSSKAQFPLPDRAALVALIGLRIGPAEREILGAITEAADAAPPKRTVCVCFGVDRAQIETAIRTGRLTTAAEIGVTLKAGTNCGSCVPELKEILGITLVPA